MTNKTEAISEILLKQNIKISGEVVADRDVDGNFLVRVPVKRNAENKQTPSHVRLEEARKELESSGFNVSFLLTDELKNDIEAGLRATLLHQEGERIRNVFMSSTAGAPHVWIEAKRELSDDIFNSIKKSTLRYLIEFNINPKSITTTSGYKFPSILVCTRCVRKHAPVDVSGVSSALSAEGFTIPSEDWLKRRLDTMRKDGIIIWVSGNKYCLPMTSIRKLGTSKTRMSPDVSRLLALARRTR